MSNKIIYIKDAKEKKIQHQSLIDILDQLEISICEMIFSFTKLIYLVSKNGRNFHMKPKVCIGASTVQSIFYMIDVGIKFRLTEISAFGLATA